MGLSAAVTGVTIPVLVNRHEPGRVQTCLIAGSVALIAIGVKIRAGGHKMLATQSSPPTLHCGPERSWAVILTPMALIASTLLAIAEVGTAAGLVFLAARAAWN